MLPPNVCSSSGSVRRPCGGTAPPQKSVYGNNRTNRGVSPTNGAVWKAVRSGRLLLTADLVWKSWGRICLQTLRESRGGRKESRDRILFCPPVAFIDLTGSWKGWRFWGLRSVLGVLMVCNGIGASCAVSADVMMGSSWFCIAFVILMSTASCTVLNTFCSVPGGTVFHVLC